MIVQLRKALVLRKMYTILRQQHNNYSLVHNTSHNPRRVYCTPAYMISSSHALFSWQHTYVN